MGTYAPVEEAERARRRELFRVLREAALRASTAPSPPAGVDSGTREAVVLTLELLERDPLASAGAFPGDLLRGLMELPPQAWRADPALYDRFRAAIRAAAMARRHAPPDVQQAFWRDLPNRIEAPGAPPE
jgi:hypothetical protein